MAGRLRHALDMLVGGNVPVTFSPDQEDIPMTTPDQRADELLYSILSPAEARCLRDTGYVLVTAKSGRKYQVGATEVWEMDSGGRRKVAHYCLVPTSRQIPFSDRLLAKYLLIKGNEEAFRAKAVRHSTNPFDDYNRRRGEFAGLAGYNEPPPQRHAVRRIRFTQDMRHTGPDWQAYNYGLPPNVRANAERNTITYEGVEYRIINQTIEHNEWDRHGLYPYTRTVTLEVEPVGPSREERERFLGEWVDRHGPFNLTPVPLANFAAGDCDVDRGVGMTASVSLGPTEQARIREYMTAARNMTTVSLYGSQWYVTEYSVEQNPENPALYTFNLVRR